MKEIISKQYRHGLHLPANEIRKDTVFVNETITYNDGTTEENLKMFEDFKRPYYLTKPIYRNYEQKRQWEEIERLQKFEATDSQLAKHIGNKLKLRGKADMRSVLRSPYLYGASQPVTNIIKMLYKDTYPDSTTPYTVAFLDIENDVDTKEISVITMMMRVNGRVKVKTSVNKKLLNYRDDVVTLLKNNMPDNISEMLDLNLIDFDLTMMNDEKSIILEIMDTAHKWKPNVLTAWNAYFDFNTIRERGIRCLYC